MIFKPSKSLLKGVTTLVMGGTSCGKTTFVEYCLTMLQDGDTRFYGFLSDNSSLHRIFYKNGDLTGEDLENADSLMYIFKKQCHIRQIKMLIYEKQNMILEFIRSTNYIIYKRLRKAIAEKTRGLTADDLRMEVTVYLIRYAVRNMDIDIDKLPGDELRALISSCRMMGFNVCIVIDDVTESLEVVCAKKTFRKILMKIITKSRHYGITIILSSHSPNAVNNIFRENAKNFVWCSPKDYDDAMATTKYPKAIMKAFRHTLFRRKWDLAIYNKARNDVGTIRYNPETDINLPIKMGAEIPVRPVRVGDERVMGVDDLIKWMNISKNV